MNAHEYTYGTSGKDPDSAMVELRFRPDQLSNTIHPDRFKRFKLVIALSRRFLNHQDSSRITKVLLRITLVHPVCARALLRIMVVHHYLINLGES